MIKLNFLKSHWNQSPKLNQPIEVTKIGLKSDGRSWDELSKKTAKYCPEMALNRRYKKDCNDKDRDAI